MSFMDVIRIPPGMTVEAPTAEAIGFILDHPRDLERITMNVTGIEQTPEIRQSLIGTFMGATESYVGRIDGEPFLYWSLNIVPATTTGEPTVFYLATATDRVETVNPIALSRLARRFIRYGRDRYPYLPHMGTTLAEATRAHKWMRVIGFTPIGESTFHGVTVANLQILPD